MEHRIKRNRQSIDTSPKQCIGTNGCHTQYDNQIAAQFRIMEESTYLSFQNAIINQRVVHSRHEHEESECIFNGFGMIHLLQHRTVCAIATCCNRHKAIIDSVKQIHSAKIKRKNAKHRQQQIDKTYPFGCHADTWMHLVMERSRTLSREEFQFAHSKGRQDGNREEHNSNTSYPLGQTAPKEDTSWLYIAIVNDRRTRRCEPRHGFEKGTCHIRQRTAQEKWQHTDNGENEPNQRNHQIPILSTHRTACIATHKHGYRSKHNGNHRRPDKRHVVAMIVEANHHAQCHESCFHEKQNSNYLYDEFPVNHINKVKNEK